MLDALTRAGASGWHLPFGWGRAPASEVAHWAMFGYAGEPFCGRAVLEALGGGLEVAAGVPTLHAALRTSRAEGDRVWLTGRAGAGDAGDTAALLAALDPLAAAHGARLAPLGLRGEATLSLPGLSSAAVTDSDPFFEHLHPWLAVLPTEPAGEPVAGALTALLLAARDALAAHPVNAGRTARGLPALDVLTTKWAGVRAPLPSFAQLTGVAGGAVPSSRLYRGLAVLLGLDQEPVAADDDVATDLRARFAAAEALIARGARFVHVHSKATDEAGHTKEPRAKLGVLEAADPALGELAGLARRAIVAITGDHATPSSGGLLHSGDPTPLLVLGPGVRPDRVSAFGERHAREGWYGAVAAADLLPLLFGHANRPDFMGHRPTPRRTIALPDDPPPMRVAPALSPPAAPGT
ncbi:alkaline phosphatase family protein [Baekduia soli]|uniref:hypothetical protein n=1 Tax=Baekduia soli TaxID=496014 RepID=UPI001E39E84B|nr:hypothetical protein [Baekduia soli]